MKALSKNVLALSLIVLCGNQAQSCELPAHPSAAAMPVGIVLRGETTEKKVSQCDKVKLVQGDKNGNFYYLIPEGSKIKMKVVWDPVNHNSAQTTDKATFDRKVEEYDYIKDAVDGNVIEPDKEIGSVGGFYFFPVQAMGHFFTLQGNRKDAKEAFTRYMGSDFDDKGLISCRGLGPELAFSAFAVKGDNLGFSVVEGKAPGYKDTPVIPPEYVVDQPKIDGINNCLPSTFKHSRMDGEVYILEDSKLKKVGEDPKHKSFNCCEIPNSTSVLVYSNCGTIMDDINFGLEEPKLRNYKAFIQTTNPQNQVFVEGLGCDSEDENAAHPQDDKGYFYVTFTTPSIGGCAASSNEEDAVIKIKVNSPPAGYRLSNLFWAWEETTYKRVTSGSYELAEGSSAPENSTTQTATSSEDDTSTETSTDTDSEEATEPKAEKYSCKDIVVYQRDKTRKCSTGVVIVMAKGQDPDGFSAFKIYDDCGPISSDLKIANSELVYKEVDDKSVTDLSTKINFTLEILDSNPFIDKEIVAAGSGEKSGKIDISQNTGKMDLSFFYNYPVYQYSPKTDVDISAMNGVGLVDLQDSDRAGKTGKFKSYTHKTNWHWKKATNVKIDSITASQIKNNSGHTGLTAGQIIGAKAVVKGSFVVDNPKPWHEFEGDKGHNFSIFALTKDTAGKTHLAKAIFGDGRKETYASADPKNNSEAKFAINPVNDKVESVAANLSGTTAPYFAKELNATWNSPKEFQDINHLASKDTTAPEIQVVVLDTRTNKYHVFGTAENVAGDFNKLTTKNDTGYDPSKYQGKQIPYINKNSAISKNYKYDNFNNVTELFDRYLKGDSKGNAVSTLFDYSNKSGFVCQKNARLVFYPRAFDNIGYMNANGGIQSFKATLKDPFNSSGSKEVRSVNEALDYVFRMENVDDSGSVNQPYVLEIEATDFADPPNTRKFNLNIGVTGRSLDIRTLEEKRERIN